MQIHYPRRIDFNVCRQSRLIFMRIYNKIKANPNISSLQANNSINNCFLWKFLEVIVKFIIYLHPPKKLDFKKTNLLRCCKHPDPEQTLITNSNSKIKSKKINQLDKFKQTLLNLFMVFNPTLTFIYKNLQHL